MFNTATSLNSDVPKFEVSEFGTQYLCFPVVSSYFHLTVNRQQLMVSLKTAPQFLSNTNSEMANRGSLDRGSTVYTVKSVKKDI